MSQKLPNMLDNTITKIREMVNPNSVVGEPIVAGDVTIVPISKIGIGMGGAGSDFVSKNSHGGENPFGGGVATGIKITPVAFIIIKDGSVRMLPVATPAITTTDRLVEMIPETLDKIVEFIDAHTNKEEE
jgi:sporulation protein YtfJ